MSQRLKLRPSRSRLLAGLAVGILSGCAAPAPPALVDPASAEHHAGKMIFAELATPDLAAAQQFYANLFGWTYAQSPTRKTGFALVLLDGRTIGAIAQRPIPPGEKRQPAWLTFMAVADVPAAETLAEAHGGRVLSMPHGLASIGQAAVLADPQGAAFAILASSSGDPPDELAAPGEWIWSSLLTRDPDADAAFYQTILGYEVFEPPGEDTARHLILASDNFARASVNAFPRAKPPMPPSWVNYVRVTEMAPMVAKATALGGHVLVPPRIDRHGGLVAVLADPQGAVFGLLEWADDQAPGQGAEQAK